MELGTGAWGPKIKMMALRGRENKFDDIFSRLDTIHEHDTDGQTDGHRPTEKTALTHSVAR